MACHTSLLCNGWARKSLVTFLAVDIVSATSLLLSGFPCIPVPGIKYSSTDCDQLCVPVWCGLCACVCVWWVGGCARNVEDGPPIKVCTAMLFTYQHCQDVDHCFTCAQHNALLPCSPPAMTSQQTLTYNLKSSGACGLCGGTSQCGRIITRRAKDGMRRTTMDPQEE